MDLCIQKISNMNFGVITWILFRYSSARDSTRTLISDSLFDSGWIGELSFIEDLTPNDIWQAFFTDSRPIKTSLPALLEVRERWTNEYLVSKFGNVFLQTEPDRENRTTDYCGLERMGKVIECGKPEYEYMRKVRVYYHMRDYIGNLTDPHFDRYVITMLDESMASELPFLRGFSCGLKRRYYQMDVPSDPLHATEFQELNFWFSKGNTYSTLHYDMNHQVMCQIDGRKEWRFWDLRTERDNIPMWSEFYESEQRSDDSPIDPLDVDLVRFPQFLNAKWTNTTLNPGECLLIPNYHWLHYVRGYEGERNIGFSVHVNAMAFTPDHLYDCDDMVENITHSSLGNFTVTVPFPGDPRETEYNVARMGRGYWKDYALHAIKEMIRGHSLPEILDLLTNGRSGKSKRIQSLLADIPTDTDVETIVKALFTHGALWREVDYLATASHR